MTGSTEMKLVFRLAGIGFSLPVNLLVEIVELERAPGMPVGDDAKARPLVEFRGAEVPVVDIAQAFELPAAPEGSSLTMLVLHGELGHWGALVHAVEGIRSNSEFEERNLSPLFSLGGGKLYDNIDTWRDEPLIQFEPERFAPGGDTT